MPRIQPIAPADAEPRVASTLRGVEHKLGILPNVIATLGRSPAALDGYLGLSGALGAGALTGREREIVAIAVAQENACGYCLSAHATMGRGAGLSDGDITMARDGEAADRREQAIVAFALAVTRRRGGIDDADLAAARDAGLEDGVLVETVAHVAVNLLTNYVNRVAETTVDFPEVDLQRAA